MGASNTAISQAPLGEVHLVSSGSSGLRAPIFSLKCLYSRLFLALDAGGNPR